MASFGVFCAIPESGQAGDALGGTGQTVEKVHLPHLISKTELHLHNEILIQMILNHFMEYNISVTRIKNGVCTHFPYIHKEQSL